MSAHVDTSVWSPINAWSAFARRAADAVAGFESNVHDPAAIQERILQGILERNAHTAFGRAFNFESIATAEEYAERVPVSAWPEYESWIERARSEPEAVLTSDRPIHFERTSGSTARAREFPYTPQLIQEFQRTLIVWLAQLYAECPEVAGPAYWSLSPVTGGEERTPSGVPIGSATDAVYLRGCAAELLLPTVVDTQEALSAPDWRLRTLAMIAAHEDLALISVWSPTYLRALLDCVLGEADSLTSLHVLRDMLPRDRYRALRDAIEAHDFSLLWPRLRVISAWSDGPSARYADGVSSLFARARIVPKGLFSTEGVVSFSWGLDGLRPLAIESHFLEFIAADGRIRRVDELAEGHVYETVLTTGGGLYRYRIGDLIEVTGFMAQTPTVRFAGRADLRADLVGEKLDESLVARAFEAIGLSVPAVLVPMVEAGRPGYLLLVEACGRCDSQAIAGALEEELAASYHYRIARRSHQLDAVIARDVANLSTILQASWEALGRCAGDAKSTRLIASTEIARALIEQCAMRGVSV